MNNKRQQFAQASIVVVNYNYMKAAERMIENYWCTHTRTHARIYHLSL